MSNQPIDMSKTNLNLFTTKGMPRQRAPKKSRWDYSTEGWKEYQNEQSRIRAVRYKEKQTNPNNIKHG